MGLSIHYSGTIKELSQIQILTDELEDICKGLGWKYHIWDGKNFDDAVNKNFTVSKIDFDFTELRGITMIPEGCEPVDVVFFPTGILCSVIKLKLNDGAANELMVETVSVKTQFAGPDVHKTIIELFIYLQPKYFSAFEMSDESYYWETRDVNKMLQQFARYNFILDKVAAALQNFNSTPNETAALLAERLEEYLKNKLDDKTD
jgi:hypothetical protein